MNSTVKERLQFFIKSKGLSQARFEQAVGISNGYVNNIRKGIGAAILQKMVKNYPDLNPSWLMSGEGEMSLPAERKANEDVLLELIRQKDQTIQEQAMEIGRLQERLRGLCCLTGRESVGDES